MRWEVTYLSVVRLFDQLCSEIAVLAACWAPSVGVAVPRGVLTWLWDTGRKSHVRFHAHDLFQQIVRAWFPCHGCNCPQRVLAVLYEVVLPRVPCPHPRGVTRSKADALCGPGHLASGPIQGCDAYPSAEACTALSSCLTPLLLATRSSFVF